MAAGYRSRVVAAIASLGDDGVIVSPEDYSNYEALIGEYFNESDESGSDDSECGKCIKFLLFKRFLTFFKTFQNLCLTTTALMKIMSQVYQVKKFKAFVTTVTVNLAETYAMSNTGEDRYHEGNYIIIMV